MLELVDLVIRLFENRWLQLVLTIGTVVSILIASRSYIYRVYLNRTLYERVDNKWMLKMLLDKMGEKKIELPKEKKPEELCEECKSLVRHDNRPVVSVFDRGDNYFMTFHRDCIEKTQMRVPVLLKGHKMKLARLARLWMLSRKEDKLATDIASIIIVQQREPTGIRYCLLVPTDIKPVSDSTLDQISKPDPQIENAIREAYQSGPWGKDFYEKAIWDPESWKEKHGYFLRTLCLAEILVTRANKVSLIFPKK